MTLNFNTHSLNYEEQGGGGITPSGTKTITENGVHDVTNYANASVNVEGTEPTLVTKTITQNGTYVAVDDSADGYSSVSVNVESTQPVITSINVTPTTAAQTFTAPTGTDGYSPINVFAVTNDIDSNISASNIKSGVTILGVQGTVTELVGETKTITVNGTYAPLVGNGFTSVSVNVPATQPTLITKTISTNGTYSAQDDSADGYSEVSVSVSGGGSASLYDTLKSECDSITTDTTAADLASMGFQYIDENFSMSTIYNSNGGFIAFTFQENIPNLFFNTSSILAVKVASGATISNTSTSGVKKIDFTNCETPYMIIGKANINTDYSMYICALDETKTSTTDYMKYWKSFIKSCYVRFLSLTYTSENPRTVGSINYLPSYFGMSSPFLEKVGTSNNLKFDVSWGFTGSASDFRNEDSPFAPVSKKVSVTDLCTQFLPNFQEGVTTLSSSITKNLINNYEYNGILMELPDIPYVLDCSGMTAGSSTWYFTCNSYTEYKPSRFRIPSKLYVKLPDWNIDTRVYLKGSWFPNNLHPKYYKFMADNAPSVSGKTIKINALDQENINNYDNTILSTFTSKGWTVASS